METTISNPTTDVKSVFGNGKYSPLAIYTKWTKRSGWSGLNLIGSNQPIFSLATSSLHYGGSVFEGMKASKDPDGDIRIFRMEEHFQRFNESLELMDLPTVPAGLFDNSLKNLIANGGFKVDFKSGGRLYLRPLLLNSTDELGAFNMEDCYFAILTGALEPYSFKTAKCKIELESSRAEEDGVAKAKTCGNYAKGKRADSRAQKEGCSHVLWTNAGSHDHIEEFSTMNFFIVKNGEIITPPLSQGTILAGITRKTILEISSSLGLRVGEAQVKVSDLILGVNDGSITEMWGTGSASLVVPMEGFMCAGEYYPLPPYDNKSICYRLANTINSAYIGDSFLDYTKYTYNTKQ